MEDVPGRQAFLAGALPSPGSVSNHRRSLRSLYYLCRSLGSLRSLLLFAEPGCSCVLLVAWPKAKITLRQAARIIHKSWEGFRFCSFSQLSIFRRATAFAASLVPVNLATTGLPSVLSG